MWDLFPHLQQPTLFCIMQWCKTGKFRRNLWRDSPIFCPMGAKMAASADKGKFAGVPHCQMRHPGLPSDNEISRPAAA